MGHDHHQHHHHGTQKNILLAFFLNSSFAIIELIGAYFTNSMAIYSDALHDLGDSIALLFAYYSEKFSHKVPSKTYTYGYRRFSVLSALINSFILLFGSVFIIYEATLRIMDPAPVKAEGMFILAILGVLVNGFAAYRLSKGEGINQRVVVLHLLEDILGWVAVLVVSVILYFKPWFILDAILSILISLIILRGVYKNLMSLGSIFLQRFPDDIELEKIQDEIKEIALIKDVHGVRGWALDDISYSLSFHVVVDSNTTMAQVDEVKLKVKKILSRHHVKFSSIEFEGESFHCDDQSIKRTT